MLNNKNKHINGNVLILMIIIIIIISIFYYFNFSKTIAHGQILSSGDCNVGDFDICTNTSGILNNNTDQLIDNSSVINYQYSNQSLTSQNDSYLSFGVFNTLDPTDYPYCVYLTSSLSYQSKGENVTALQKYLTDRGFLETGTTGFYGRATELAVKKFQYKNEIDTTGIAGPITRETIKNLTCNPITKTVTINKPVSPAGKKYIDQDFSSTSYISSSASQVNLPKTSVVIPTTKANSSTTNYVSVKIPTTTNVKSEQIITSPSLNHSSIIAENNSSKLSSISGIFSSINKNNLYFIYKTNSTSPGFCMTLNNTDCTKNTNYQPLTDGVSTDIFDASNLSNG
jgi:hypothetical protein